MCLAVCSDFDVVQASGMGVANPTSRINLKFQGLGVF